MTALFRLVALCALAACLATTASAGGKKAPKFTVSFHLQTQRGEGRKMVFEQLVAGKKHMFRIIPEISTADVAAYRSFPSENNNDFGIELQLNRRGQQRLAAMSTNNNGKWLVAQANGRVVDAVRIDGPVTDGRLVIWKGISPPELRALEGTLPYIGETPERFKARKKALKNQR